MSFFGLNNFGIPPNLNNLLFNKQVIPTVPGAPQLPLAPGVLDTFQFNQSPIIAATAYHPVFGNLDFGQLQNPSTYQTLARAARNPEYVFPPIPGFQEE
jgi:hypothetical protein